MYKDISRSITTGTLLLTLLISGCSLFSGPAHYFRDRSVDYAHEKEAGHLVIPDNIQAQTEPFTSIMPVPDNKHTLNASNPSQKPNDIPAPVNTVMHAGSYSYQLLSSRHKILISSNASQDILWARLIAWLNAEHIPVIKKDKSRGLIETRWFTPSGQKNHGWLYRTYHQFFSNKGNQKQAVALRFNLLPGDSGGFYNIVINTLQQPAIATKKVDWNDNKSTMSSALSQRIAHEFLVYMVEHSGDQTGPSEEYAFNAKTMTAMITDGNGNPLLKVQSSFDTAWTETGKALDKAGIKIQQANHAAGIYHITLTAPENKGSEETEEDKSSGIDESELDETKTQEDTASPSPYRLILAPANDGIYLSLEKNINTIAPVSLAKQILETIRNSMQSSHGQVDSSITH